MPNYQKRIEALAELYESERSYINDLVLWEDLLRTSCIGATAFESAQYTIIDTIMKDSERIKGKHLAMFIEMKKKNEAVLGSVTPRPDGPVTNDMISELESFPEELKHVENTILEYFSVFENLAKDNECYIKYTQNLPKAEYEFERLMATDKVFNKRVTDFLVNYNLIDLGIRNFFYRPSVKISRYPILLKAIAKNEADSDKQRRYYQLIRNMDELAKKIDLEYKIRSEFFTTFMLAYRLVYSENIKSKFSLGLIYKKTKLIKEGKLIIKKSKLDPASYKHVFVFNRVILICLSIEGPYQNIIIDDDPIFLSRAYLLKDVEGFAAGENLGELYPIFIAQKEHKSIKAFYFEDESTRDLYYYKINMAIQTIKKDMSADISIKKISDFTDTLLCYCRPERSQGNFIGLENMDHDENYFDYSSTTDLSSSALAEEDDKNGVEEEKITNTENESSEVADDKNPIETEEKISTKTEETSVTENKVPDSVVENSTIDNVAPSSMVTTDSLLFTTSKDNDENTTWQDNSQQTSIKDSVEQTTGANNGEDGAATDQRTGSKSNVQQNSSVSSIYEKYSKRYQNDDQNDSDNQKPTNNQSEATIKENDEGSLKRCTEADSSGKSTDNVSHFKETAHESSDYREFNFYKFGEEVKSLKPDEYVEENLSYYDLFGSESVTVESPSTSSSTINGDIKQKKDKIHGFWGELCGRSVLTLNSIEIPNDFKIERTRRNRKMSLYSTKEGIFKSFDGRETRIFPKAANKIFYDCEYELLIFICNDCLHLGQFHVDMDEIQPEVFNKAIKNFFYGKYGEIAYIALVSIEEFTFSVIHLLSVTFNRDRPVLNIGVVRKLYVGFTIFNIFFLKGRIIISCKDFEIIEIDTLRTQELLEVYDTTLSLLLESKEYFHAKSLFKLKNNLFLLCFDGGGYIVDKAGRYREENITYDWEVMGEEFYVYKKWIIVMGKPYLAVFEIETGRMIFQKYIPGVKLVQGCKTPHIHDDNSLYTIDFGELDPSNEEESGEECSQSVFDRPAIDASGNLVNIHAPTVADSSASSLVVQVKSCPESIFGVSTSPADSSCTLSAGLRPNSCPESIFNTSASSMHDLSAFFRHSDSSSHESASGTNTSSATRLPASIRRMTSPSSKTIDSTSISSAKGGSSTSLRHSDRDSRDFDSIINEYMQSSRTITDSDSWGSTVITYLRSSENSNNDTSSTDHSSFSEYSQLAPLTRSYKFQSDGESSKNGPLQHSSYETFSSSQVEFVNHAELIKADQQTIYNRCNVLVHHRKAKIKGMMRISRKKVEQWKYKQKDRNRHKSFEELDIIKEYEQRKGKEFE